MKKIYTIFFIFLLSMGGVFAQDEIDLELSASKISLGESLHMTITLESPERQAQNVSLDIPGIENFQIFSQSNSYSYQNYNGVTTGTMSYGLDLVANTPGDFTIGPVKILTGSGEILDDEVIQISVGNPSKSTSLDDEVIDLKQAEIVSPELKGDRNVGFPWLLIFGGMLFFGLFYYLLLLYFKKPQQEENGEIIPEPKTHSRQEKIIQYFTKLADENTHISSQEFYKKYNRGIREVFVEKGIANAHKITLSELAKIEDIQNEGIFSLFKKSYKHEYSGVDVLPETRQKYIEDILGLLQK